MKTQSICLALAVVLTCPFAPAQGVQPNSPNDRLVPHRSLMGANVFQETPRGLLGLPTQHRQQADFTDRPDSLRASRVQLPI
jgi:hypothetical protein